MAIGSKLNNFHSNLVIKQVLGVYNLLGGGTAELVRTGFNGGMSVGTAPLAVKLDVSPESGGRNYPKGWYILRCSFHKAQDSFERGVFPEGMLQDVYKQAWQYEIFEPGSTQ